MKHREEVSVRGIVDSQNIEKAFVYIERDLSILGATAVEDELQDCIIPMLHDEYVRRLNSEKRGRQWS